MTYTFAGDGSSDAVLLPILTWCLRQEGVTPIIGHPADFGRIPRTQSLEERLRAVADLYPCDILFVHRDAEREDPGLRREEIARAVRTTSLRTVPVVPVRMTEAWLLGHEPAIRAAAGNPSGTEELMLPDLRRIESIPDPKEVLHAALRRASGLGTRRRAALPVSARVRRIPDHIDDFAYLNGLPAFRNLREDIAKILRDPRPAQSVRANLS